MRFYKKRKHEELGKDIPSSSVIIEDLGVEFRDYDHSNLSMEIEKDGIFTTIPFTYLNLTIFGKRKPSNGVLSKSVNLIIFSVNWGNGFEKVLLEEYPPSYGIPMLRDSDDIDVLG